MRGAAVGRLEWGQRFARCDLRIWYLGVNLTRHFLATRHGRRIALRISPGRVNGREKEKRKKEEGRGKKDEGRRNREEGQGSARRHQGGTKAAPSKHKAFT